MKNWLALIPYFAVIAIFVLARPETPRPQRSLASDKIENCLEVLKTFYSNERNKLLNTRLKNTDDDALMFLRSFPPLYYKMVEELKWKESFAKISKIESVMPGDVHVNNFGLKFFNGKLRLSVNDYDDLTMGPIFLDVIRHLTSADLAGVELNKTQIDDFLIALKRGLKNKGTELSSVNREILEEAEQLEMLDPKVVDQVTKKFIKKKTPNTPMTDEEIRHWAKLVEDFGKIQDSYAFVKESGGSGGLSRFEFVLEKEGKTYWLEAKEWTAPSYNIASNTTAPTDQKRYELITIYDKPIVPSKIVKYKEKTYLLRNQDARQSPIEIEKIKKAQRADILIDEAYALGDFYRYYLENPEDFLKALDETRSGDILDFVQKLSKMFKRTQKSLE